MVFPWFSHGSQVKRLEEESAKALEEAEKAAQAARDAAEHALQAGNGGVKLEMRHGAGIPTSGWW